MPHQNIYLIANFATRLEIDSEKVVTNRYSIKEK